MNDNETISARHDFNALLGSESLGHYQIKGAKHGVRRFQNYDGSLTPEGRARYGVGDPKEKTKEDRIKDALRKKKNKDNKKLEKAQQRAEAKKAKTAEKEAQEHENLKKYLRTHPKKMYRYRSELTIDDVNELSKQIEFDRKLKDIRTEEIQRGWDKVARISKNLGTVKTVLNNTKDIYNIAMDVNNMLVDEGKISGTKHSKIGSGGDNKPQDDKSKKNNN